MSCAAAYRLRPAAAPRRCCALTGSGYHQRRQRLADVSRKRGREPQKSLEQLQASINRGAMLEAIRSRPHLVCEDIAGGCEMVPIPVFNEIDQQGLPPDLEYTRDYDYSFIEGDPAVQVRTYLALGAVQHALQQGLGRGWEHL